MVAFATRVQEACILLNLLAKNEGPDQTTAMAMLI